MMSVSTEHITKTPGVCGGKACIAGHRVRVMDVAIYHDRGHSPAEIVETFPSITLADVYAAIAYYLDHPDEIAADLRRAEEIGEQYRGQFPSKLQAKLAANPGLRERILREQPGG